MSRKKIFAALALTLFFGMQSAAAFRWIPAGMPLYRLPYQFGPYAWSLIHDGTYADCSQSPCKYANRMPVLPLTLAALGKLSLEARPVALLKNGLLLLFVAAVLFWLLDVQARFFPERGSAWLALLPLIVALPIVRHSAMIQYEEGLLIELLPLWTLCFLLGSWAWMKRESKDGRRLVLAGLALATLIYLTKDALILLWSAALLLTALWCIRFKDVRTLLGGLCCVAAVLGWGLHNRLASGRFSIGSSWDGENSYRGFNTQSAVIYPYLSLDETLGPPHPVPWPQGGALLLGGKWPRFKNEWDWNDYFRQNALAWVESHPSMALRFQFEKLARFCVSLKTYPFESFLDAEHPGFSHAEAIWETGSLLIGRLAQAELLVLLIALCFRKDRAGQGLAFAVLAANLAYAAPYVLCFNYERHIAAYFTVVAASLVIVLSAWPGSGKRDALSRAEEAKV